MTTPTGYRRTGTTAILYTGALLIGLTLVAVPSSSVHLQAAHGLSDEQYGRVFIPQLLLAIGGALLAGPVIRRFSLRSLYVVALLAFAASQAALGLTEGAEPTAAWSLVMASTALFGFGFGFGGGPLNGLVADLHPRRAAAAIAGLHFMAGLGLSLGPLYFRALESAGYWRTGPACLAGLALLLVLVAPLVPRRDPPAAGADTGNPPAQARFFWLMILLAFLYAIVEGAFSNWAVIFVSVEKAASRDGGAFALAAFWAGLTAGRLLTAMTVMRIGETRLWMMLPLLMTAAFLLLPRLQAETSLVLGYGFAGLACSAFFPLMVSIASRPFPGHLSWIASMLTASLMLGVGAGSYLIGAVSRFVPIERMYLYFALVPLVTLAVMWWSLRQEARAA